MVPHSFVTPKIRNRQIDLYDTARLERVFGTAERSYILLTKQRSRYIKLNNERSVQFKEKIKLGPTCRSNFSVLIRPYSSSRSKSRARWKEIFRLIRAQCNASHRNVISLLGASRTDTASERRKRSAMVRLTSSMREDWIRCPT